MVLPAIIAADNLRAIRASGLVVQVEPGTFMQIVERQPNSLVVHATDRVLFTKKDVYLMSYRGLGFSTRSPSPLTFPTGTEVIEAQGIWVPE